MIEFWIDVGGTFTDCLARLPDGHRRRHKTLSSGVVKGSAGVRATPDALFDSRRIGDPIDFWIGWHLRLLDDRGEVTQQRTVVAFDASRGKLTLDTPLHTTATVGQNYELDAGLDAPLVAMRYLLGRPLARPLPPSVVRLGTTRGTNALLTRSGSRVAWVTTRGLADVLRIGHQARPHLFELNIRKPLPLYECAIEVDERITAAGEILVAPNLKTVERQLKELRDAGIEALAIGFLHAYLNADHERQVAAVARRLGFRDVSLSSDQASLINLVARGETTVVNAYLNPVLRDYVERLSRALDESPETALGTNSSPRLRLMTSAGGLVSADQFQGKDSILSGPAGGVVGCAGVARAAGFERAIGFDMGGTSTDVTRYDGHFTYEYESEKAGVRVVAPMLAIETVAAGGGSVCHFDGVKLAVGPDSAGAQPGPACYGRGGPLTITDVNLALGRIPVDAFPFRLDHSAVERRLRELCTAIKKGSGSVYTSAELAAGFLDITNANMAQAIRSVSISQGYDPRDYLLVAFGGAAPQHACAVARELQIHRVLDPPDGSVLSALGMGLADVTRHVQQGIYRPLNDVQSSLSTSFAKLESDARRMIADEGIDPHNIKTRRSIELRYLGTDWPLTIDVTSTTELARQFAREHRRLYGYQHEGRSLEVVAIRVEAIGHCGWSLPPSSRRSGEFLEATEHRDIVVKGVPRPAACFQRRDLQPGDRVQGPALVVQDTSTTVIDTGWSAEVMTHHELLLSDDAPCETSRASTESDPITLEIFNSHFQSIAHQMGITLRNTSSSVNVKERLDFSCALFTHDASLVVNAPHIPVHLGAMSETVKYLLRDHPKLAPGDVLITNDPFRGGSHLPDVTVVTPVFDKTTDQLQFLVASRAHHAEIGGITPGSMPPFSRNLAEEGVLIRSFKLIDQDVSRLDRLEQLLREAPYPSRDVESNMADVRAQIAANRQGAQDLQRLVKRYGWPVTAAYMNHIQAAAETKMRRALAAKPNGSYSFVDHLDDGSAIQVRIDIEGDHARIDFSGSAGVVAGNLNANLAIVTAAVMYSLRCLIDEPIPLNQGMMLPIELTVPPGMLNPPARDRAEDCPAVAGGNVETSQRIVDVLLGALGMAAASQGTMNNLLFGSSQFGYYETICGGSGATANRSGADAVHTHMTNTRLTDPEILEQRFPIRIHRFAVRPGSGGDGEHHGGCGVIRELEFLAPLQVSILSQRRGPFAPFGLAGGRAGQRGENRLRRAGQPEEMIGGRAQFEVEPGDILTILTPGGGGYGPPD